MPGLADLLRPSPLESDDSTQPAVLVAQVHDTDPLRVTVPTIDGGRDALRAFGTLPVTAAAGDEVRIMRDEYGGLVVIAWETSGA